MKINGTRMIAMLLSCILTVGCFSACGNPNAKSDITDSDKDYKGNNGNESMDKDPDNDGEPSKDHNDQNTSSWINDSLKSADNVRASPFYDDLAFVQFDWQRYFIDRTGNIIITLSEQTTIGSQEAPRFCNGLLLTSDCLINTKGEVITAEDLGGTALLNKVFNDELLEGGYIVVDKITSNFARVTYESAVYNTKLEQIQPYSTELYDLFHREGIWFYNGFVYYWDSREIEGGWEYEEYAETYHIATNTWAEYYAFPNTFVNEMDLAYFNKGSYAENKGMYRNGELILDLSQYETLFSVEFVGDFGLAEFENEEHENYFTIIDTEGNFKFDPINCGGYSAQACQFNGDVVLVKTYIDTQDGKDKYQLESYDIEGRQLGCIEVELAHSTWVGATVMLGQDTVLIYNDNAIFYYNTKLEPLFPTE